MVAILMLSATFTSAIISSFEAVLANVLILSSFIPMITGSGGNAGSQASVSVIRALSLGEIHFKSIFLVLWKEFRVSILCGITLAAANFVKLLLFDLNGQENAFMIALVISLTLVGTIIMAKLVVTVCLFWQARSALTLPLWRIRSFQQSATRFHCLSISALQS